MLNKETEVSMGTAQLVLVHMFIKTIWFHIISSIQCDSIIGTIHNNVNFLSSAEYLLALIIIESHANSYFAIQYIQL